MSAEVDIEEVKETIALRLVSLLAGPDRPRFMSFLPIDQQPRLEHRYAMILTCIAKSRSGSMESERSVFWNLTLDVVFKHNIQFGSFVLGTLCSWQDKDISEAAERMLDIKEDLDKHKAERGAKEDLDQMAKRNRSSLEERFRVATTELQYNWRVEKVMRSIVRALPDGERAESRRGGLYNL